MANLAPAGRFQDKPNSRTVGLYGNMKFAQVGYQEYPKLITTASGARITVNSMEEERDVLLDQPVVGVTKSALAAERDSLAARVNELQWELLTVRNSQANSALALQNTELLKKIDELTLELLAVKAELVDARKAAAEPELPMGKPKAEGKSNLLNKLPA